MKDPAILPIDDCVKQFDTFDAILDARSPSEFAIDHLPGARNTPVLDDQQRAMIGTLYRHSAFEAKRRGAALVARNIADIVDALPPELTREWRPLVYCWRGGNRSGALATVLVRIGFRVNVLEGGYREFRRRVAADLAELPQRLHFRVLAGRTGSGKSVLLQRLAALGAQVLDLERIACHRGSVLGGLPAEPQPAQKLFESRIWQTLRGFDPQRPIYVESESKKIGQNHLPDALLDRIRAADCIRLQTGDDVRIALLSADYRHFIDDPQSLWPQLDCLIDLHGRARIAEWKALAADGRWADFIVAVLHGHYDPAYDRSMKRNFGRLPQAFELNLPGADPASFDQAARAIIASEGEAAGTIVSARPA